MRKHKASDSKTIMGSSAILIVGDNWQHQLQCLQSMEYAEPDNPFIQIMDVVEDAMRVYPGGMRLALPGEGACSRHRPRDGIAAFVAWARTHYGIEMLEDGLEADFHGAHRWGWFRVNPTGSITEVMTRSIPGGFYRFLRGTCAELQLKPGAWGWDADSRGQLEPSQGMVGSARIADIDLEAMRQQQLTTFEAQWDYMHSVTQGKSWMSLAAMRQGRIDPEAPYDSALENTLLNMWRQQPTLRKLEAANVELFAPWAGDAMLASRSDYVRIRSQSCGLLSYSDAIRNSQPMSRQPNDDWLDELPSDTLLTLAGVKC